MEKSHSKQQLKESLIAELKQFAEHKGKSPKRRDVANLAARCYNHFGSFNEAKKKAGLSIGNVRINKFPKNAFKIDADLAQIVSYITFDGHLYKDFKGMMYSSKNLKDLKEFEKIVKRKFGLPARYHLYSAGNRNQTHKIYFFNKMICQFLFNNGAPKGDKVIQKFNIPSWIISSREFSREYLRVAYLCEGSIKDGKRKIPRITFTNSKWENVLDSGLDFMTSLKKMLSKFDISTSKSYISKGRVRKRDNNMIKDVRFRIKTADNHKFIREIGWMK